MGDSSISFDEGSARAWAFWQRAVASNTVEEQKTVVSEPFIPTYTISVTTAISTGTANSHLLQIMGSTLNRVYLRRLIVTQMAGAGAATQAQFQILRVTTAGTGGTSYTPATLDPTDGATTARGMTLPTGKGTESTILWTGSGTLLATVPVAGSGPVLNLDWTRERGKSPVIAAGGSTGVVLKNITGVATATVLIHAEFVEAFWS